MTKCMHTSLYTNTQGELVICSYCGKVWKEVEQNSESEGDD